MDMAGDDRDKMASVDRAERAVPLQTKPHHLSSWCDCAPAPTLKIEIRELRCRSVDVDDVVTLVMDCYAPRKSLKQPVHQ